MRSTKFQKWLIENLDKRNQRPVDLARLAGLETSAIGNFVNGRRTQPAVETCKAIAKAWNIPVEEVYRAAEILPEVTEPDAITEAILYAMKGLDNKEKQDILEYAKLRSRLAEHKDHHNTGNLRRTSENPA